MQPAEPVLQPSRPDPPLVPVSFADLPGWAEDDHASAFCAFRSGARLALDRPAKTRSLGIDAAALRRLALIALELPADLDDRQARRFFETHCRPMRVDAPGFVTAYYEPELAASRTRSPRFPVPLYRRPADLVELAADERPAAWDPEARFARRDDNGLQPYWDRADIEAGALAGRDLELAWLADPVDAFFVHVQGSARLRLVEGGTLRLAYDGKSGHPYTSIGRLAVERGLLARADAHKDGLEAWLRAHREEGRALMAENRSFIFFREVELAEEQGPMGAAGVPLSAGRSLAVDRTAMTFHTPLWVEAPELADPDSAGGPFRRLMIAHDTGSAIVGPARGDIFLGSGDAAGARAGRVRHPATMVALVPERV